MSSTLAAGASDLPVTSRRRAGAPGAGRGFRADVEGLRGVAVGLVLAFHAGFAWVPGGFVGVDVFFVISGFVITNLLVAEAESTGRIDFRQFYARRARRILPSAGVAITGTVALVWLFLPPLRHVDVAVDAVASSLQVGNWNLIRLQTDYLAAGREASPLLHYWSLGVEEQFYLVWPALMLLAVLLARGSRSVRPWAAGVLLVFAAGSLWLSLSWTATNVPLAYMGSPSRAWQFCAGALVAVAGTALARAVRSAAFSTVLLALGWAGVATLVWSAAVIHESTPYPGTAALWPTLGTALVIAAGSVDDDRLRSLGPARLLEVGLVRRLGVLSFVWYLWHWPFVAVVMSRWDTDDWRWLSLAVLASLGPALLTHHFVEKPLRKGPATERGHRSALVVGVTATCLPIVLALAVGASGLRSGGSTDDDAGGEPVLAFDASRTSGMLRPSPAGAKADRPKMPKVCHADVPTVSYVPCTLGAGSSVGQVVLLGDSHAQQWYPLAQEIGKRRGVKVSVVTKSGCPPYDLTIYNPQLGRNYGECDRWRPSALSFIASVKPSLILVGAYSRYENGLDRERAAWASLLERLSVVAPVAYLQDTPYPGKNVPTCLSANLDDWSACTFPRSPALRPDPVPGLIKDGRLPGVTLLPVVDVLCPSDPCATARGGVMLYRDQSHVSNTAAEVLAPLLATRLERLQAERR